MSKRQQNQITDNNYFNYLYNLRLFKRELAKVEKLDDIEILFPKIMGYIYSSSTILNSYKDQLDVFLKEYKTNKKFENLYNDEYEKIKDIAIKIAKSRNTELLYSNYNHITFKYGNQNRKINGTFDIPMIYLYPSIALSSSELVKEKDTSYFQASNNLSDMYRFFDFRYKKITIPQNIEFFIILNFSRMNIPSKYKQSYIEQNIIAYLLTGMHCVLDTLHKVFNDKISQEYFDKKGMHLFNDSFYDIKRSNKKEHKLVYKNNKFYLNGEVLNITDTLQETLERILWAGDKSTMALNYGDLNDSDKKVIKNHKCKINKGARKIINQDLLTFNHKTRNYTLDKNIRAFEE